MHSTNSAEALAEANGGARSLQRTRLCQFPCLTGKKQGNIAKFAFAITNLGLEVQANCVFSTKFPKLKNREKILNIREFFGGNRE
jgi:hypothetical protein